MKDVVFRARNDTHRSACCHKGVYKTLEQSIHLNDAAVTLQWMIFHQPLPSSVNGSRHSKRSSFSFKAVKEKAQFIKCDPWECYRNVHMVGLSFQRGGVRKSWEILDFMSSNSLFLNTFILRHSKFSLPRSSIFIFPPKLYSFFFLFKAFGLGQLFCILLMKTNLIYFQIARDFSNHSSTIRESSFLSEVKETKHEKINAAPLGAAYKLYMNAGEWRYSSWQHSAPQASVCFEMWVFWSIIMNWAAVKKKKIKT